MREAELNPPADNPRSAFALITDLTQTSRRRWSKKSFATWGNSGIEPDNLPSAEVADIYLAKKKPPEGGSSIQSR
jgi:hypothetical protein